MRRSAWPVVGLALTAMTVSAWGETVLLAPTTTIVVLVRHAEKAAGPGDDPRLTPDGRRRAETLAAIVKDARPTAIITTQLHRAVETAQPSAAASGVTPETVSIDPGQRFRRVLPPSPPPCANMRARRSQQHRSGDHLRAR